MSFSPRPSHDERTSSEPRSSDLHRVTLAEVEKVNDNIRCYRLEAQSTIKFQPGQWLDVHIPGLEKPGGFTITSPPELAIASPSDPAIINLAVQKSPDNPAAHWFWRPRDTILGHDLKVRVGGSFVWPPPLPTTTSTHHVGSPSPLVIRKSVFVAGGVGINPLIAMLRHLDFAGDMPEQVDFMYSTKAPELTLRYEQILFLSDLVRIVSRWMPRVRLHLFITGQLSEQRTVGRFPAFTNGRLKKENLEAVLRDAPEVTVAYVCGPPNMTDELVSFFQDDMGIPKERVLCEKWW